MFVVGGVGSGTHRDIYIGHMEHTGTWDRAHGTYRVCRTCRLHMSTYRHKMVQ